MTDKKPLVILTGPTAVGKTALSIKLAKRINAEIISADSMQVYKGMDIGSAKIKKEEMEGVVHHLIDIREFDEDFNVFSFYEEAKKCISKIYENGHIPLIVGGTGFYIQSVLYDIEFGDESENDLRQRLENLAKNKGAGYIHKLLNKMDPLAANEIHENNVKRQIRAIEFFLQNKYSITKHNEEQRSKESPYNFVYFVLNDDREKIYERIDKRVDIMLEEGLVAEVKALADRGATKDMVSMQGLGYKEILMALDNEISLDEAVYIIKRDSRHFAKRQLTWFRREKEVSFINRPEYENDEEILSAMLNMLQERGIYKN